MYHVEKRENWEISWITNARNSERVHLTNSAFHYVAIASSCYTIERIPVGKRTRFRKTTRCNSNKQSSLFIFYCSFLFAISMYSTVHLTHLSEKHFMHSHWMCGTAVVDCRWQTTYQQGKCVYWQKTTTNINACKEEIDVWSVYIACFTKNYVLLPQYLLEDVIFEDCDLMSPFI